MKIYILYNAKQEILHFAQSSNAISITTLVIIYFKNSRPQLIKAYHPATKKKKISTQNPCNRLALILQPRKRWITITLKNARVESSNIAVRIYETFLITSFPIKTHSHARARFRKKKILLSVYIRARAEKSRDES